MKKILRLVLILLFVFFLFRLCSSRSGSVVTVPGSSSTTSSGNGRSSGDGGFTTSSGESVKDIAKDIERELGIGKNGSTKTAAPSKEVTRNSSDLDVATASGNHLSFKGISLSTSRSEFLRRLQAQGFRSAGANAVTGKFAGFQGCTITANGDPVRSVRVTFPKTSDWDKLEADYESLQALLTQKYGQPEVETNTATFTTGEGNIVLDANVQGTGNWNVILDYVDASAGSLTRQSSGSAIDDL